MTLDGIKQLKIDEGVELRPYRDTVGKLTIGIGRNLTDVGISEDEAEYLLLNDIKKVEAQLSEHRFYSIQPNSVKDGIANMAFNMGIAGLLNFKNMINALLVKDYSSAATFALSSLWARQVGNRADRIAQAFRDAIVD